MIEACDRLTQKLDEVAGLFRQQIQTWTQIREPALADSGAREIPDDPGADAQTSERVSLADQARRKPQPQRSVIEPGQGAGSSMQEEIGLGTAGAPKDDGLAGMAENARRLVDTFSHSRDGWQEQADSVRQSLEAIMDFLERQAAAASPKVDAAEIMSRLRNLEEEQHNLQSQFNNSR